MASKKVVGFGEVLVRLAPFTFKRFLQADQFEVHYTGAEANVLANLAINGVPTELITKLPSNLISECAKARLRKFGVGTQKIASGGERLGIYYVERGASQRPSRIVYDRRHSSFSESKPEDFDWESILSDAAYFHFSGITPALGGELLEICLDACRTARRLGVTVSCDMNYRPSLWDYESAKKAMRELAEYVDIMIGGVRDAELLGVPIGELNYLSGKALMEADLEPILRGLQEKYGFKAAAMTLRDNISASVNDLSALLYMNGELLRAKNYHVILVDRVGGGDAFSAGLLYGFYHGYEPRRIIDFAAAAFCLKHTIEQDFNISSAQEIEMLLESGDRSNIIR